MIYLLEILNQLCIYVALLVAMDLILGKTGLLSAMQASIYGTGAYATGILSAHLGISMWITLPISIMLGAVVCSSLALISIRVSDEALVLVTLAFQMIWSDLANNLGSLTGGPMGLRGIPPFRLLGFESDNPIAGLVLSATLACLALLVAAKTDISPLGRAIKAARESELFLSSCGRNAALMKAQAFALAGAIAGAAGSIYAMHVGYISPGSFDVAESIRMITALVLGGLDSLWGPIAGAVLLVGLPEAVRFLGISGSTAANIDQMVYALILIGLVALRPKGLWGRYAIR